MRNVMNHQNITHYPIVLELIRKSEQLFHSIQTMDSVMPLQDDERLFIDAIRDMNYQASRMQAEESQESHPHAPVPTPVPPAQSIEEDAAKSSPASSSEPVVVVVHEEQHIHGTILPTTVVNTASNATSTVTREPVEVTPAVTTNPLSTSLLSTTTVSTSPSVLPATTAVSTTSSTTMSTAASNVAPINTTNAATTSTQQLSDRLDHATMLAVEAAMRLNCHNAPPDVPLALSWMHRVAGNKGDAKQRDVAASAANGTPATTSVAPLPNGHVPTSNSSPSTSSSPLTGGSTSLRRPLSAVDDPPVSDTGSHPDVNPEPKRLRTV